VVKSFTVNGATATVTLADASAAYTGTGQSLTPTQTDSGGTALSEPISVTYTDADGAAVASPTNVGVYTATATITTGSNYSGSDTATEAPPAPVSPPVAPQRTLAIEPEDHLLSLILYYHQFILQWLDDELAARQIDPLFVEDFHDPMNRAVFEALEDFRLEEEDADLMDFMSERDVFIQDHFLLLWEYARNFETRKPKHIQDHHLQREVVTGLIRLRLQHNREARQQLELSIRDVSDPQEQSLLTQRFNELVVDRSRLEKAMLVYSQSAKWASNNRPTYLAAR
jgi:hypothetical protein